MKGLIIEEVVMVRPDSSVKEAAVLMLEKDVGSLLVSGLGLPIGILTDKDILRKVTAVGRDPDSVAVKEVMSFPLIAVAPETTIGEATRKMTEFRIKRLAVMNDGGAFVGLVTMTDIVGWLAKQERLSDSLVDYFLYDLP